MAKATLGMLEIRGLKELTRELRNADKRVWKELRAEFRDVGTFMAQKAAANAQSHPAAAKTLAPTFKGKGDRMGALVTLGGSGGPGKAFRAGAGWEYGSRSASDQFHNPYVSVKGEGPMGGHYLGQALTDNRDELEERAWQAVLNFWDYLARQPNL